MNGAAGGIRTHTPRVLPPEDSASANSATAAYDTTVQDHDNMITQPTRLGNIIDIKKDLLCAVVPEAWHNPKTVVFSFR